MHETRVEYEWIKETASKERRRELRKAAAVLAVLMLLGTAGVLSEGDSNGKPKASSSPKPEPSGTMAGNMPSASVEPTKIPIPSKNPIPTPIITLAPTKSPEPSFTVQPSSVIIASPTPSETMSSSPSASVVITESPAPTPSPYIESSPTPIESMGCEVRDLGKIDNGTTKQLPANSLVVGDLSSINGNPWEDTDPKTGLITILNGEASVTSASEFTYFITFGSEEEALAVAEQTKQSFLEGGMAEKDFPNYTSIDILAFPGQPQGVQTGINPAQVNNLDCVLNPKK